MPEVRSSSIQLGGPIQGNAEAFAGRRAVQHRNRHLTLGYSSIETTCEREVDAFHRPAGASPKDMYHCIADGEATEDTILKSGAATSTVTTTKPQQTST